MASFDGNGLVIDRLADIKSDMQANLRSVFGDGVNLSETSPFGVLIGIMSERYFLLYELLEAVYQASFPNTAFGIYLDEIVALNGITRNAATFSTVPLTFTRSNSINSGDVTIPVGTQVTNPLSPSVVWTTSSEGIILDGTDKVSISSESSEVGPIGALIGDLTQLVSIPGNVDSVINLVDATEGSSEETDSALKARRETQLGRSGTATEPGIRSALINLDSVRAATLILNDTGDVVDGRPSHSFEAFVAVESGFQLGQLSTLDLQDPLVATNSIELKINGTTIAGSPVIFTGDSDATMALIAEAFQDEDEISKAVYSVSGTSISLQGSTEDAFTASAIVTVGPVVVISFDAGLPADGTIDQVGQEIWDSKAAGIQSFGDFTADVVDSVGDPHTINFSDIDEVPVFVRYTLTTGSDYVDAEDAINQALVAYATANLTPGVDVLNYKVVCSASDVNAPGIEGILVEFSKVGISGPWSTANITIESFEFATIDSGNIVFLP